MFSVRPSRVTSMVRRSHPSSTTLRQSVLSHRGRSTVTLTSCARDGMPAYRLTLSLSYIHVSPDLQHRRVLTDLGYPCIWGSDGRLPCHSVFTMMATLLSLVAFFKNGRCWLSCYIRESNVSFFLLLLFTSLTTFDWLDLCL